jgi:hypothetical protein
MVLKGKWLETVEPDSPLSASPAFLTITDHSQDINLGIDHGGATKSRVSGEKMSSSKGPGTSHSSYDAFAKVDALVSKPVLGSDGAAS